MNVGGAGEIFLAISLVDGKAGALLNLFYAVEGVTV
jgi:hypothetical protein